MTLSTVDPPATEPGGTAPAEPTDPIDPADPGDQGATDPDSPTGPGRGGLGGVYAPAALTLEQLLTRGLLDPVFQPVVSLEDEVVRGVEGLIRGPQGTLLYAPDQLFAAALVADRLGELDQAGHATIAAAAAAAGSRPPLVFLNVEPAWLDEGTGEALLALLREPRPFRFAVEVSERALVERPALVLRLAAEVRRLGHLVSLDDVGTDVRSLRLLAVLEPEIVKLDRHIVRDPAGTAAVRVVPGVVAYAAATGSVVVAEGIEDDDDLAAARRLGATWGQGWRFGRPAPLAPGADVRESRATTPATPVTGGGPAAGPGEPARPAWLPVPRSARLADLLAADADAPGSSWVLGGPDWLLAARRRLPPWERPAVRTTARLVLPMLFVALGFPNLLVLLLHGFTTRAAGLQLLLPVALGGLLAVSFVRPRVNEPDVHDQSLDRILGGPLLGAGIWLALGWPSDGGLAAPATTREVLAAIAFFAGAGVLLWGTRMFLRLRWALLLLAVAVPAVPHRVAVDAAITLAVLAAAALELRWRLRHRPARDEATRVVAALTGSAERPRHHFPPALAAAAVLTALAAGLAVALLHGATPDTTVAATSAAAGVHPAATPATPLAPATPTTPAAR